MYESLKNALIEALQYELIDIKSPFQKDLDKKKVWEFLEMFSVEAGSRFFSAQAMAEMTRQIAEHFSVYNFLTSFTDRMSLRFGTDFERTPSNSSLIDIILEQHRIRRHENSIFSKDVVEMTTLPEADLESFLKGNKWAALIYVTYLTGAYQEVRKEIKPAEAE